MIVTPWTSFESYIQLIYSTVFCFIVPLAVLMTWRDLEVSSFPRNSFLHTNVAWFFYITSSSVTWYHRITTIDILIREHTVLFILVAILTGLICSNNVGISLHRTSFNQKQLAAEIKLINCFPHLILLTLETKDTCIIHTNELWAKWCFIA